MNQKERLEQIRKKHEEERRRKKFLYRRIMVAAGAIIVIVLIVLGIKGCVSAVSGRIEAKRQQEAERIAAEQVTPSPAPKPTINPYEISRFYYDGSAFIGNSLVEDLFLFDFIDNADYFGKAGLTVTDAMTEPVGSGNVPAVDELKEKSYSKIFMIFGENELGWASSDSFAEQYGKLVDKARTNSPNAQIYLLAITPITQKVSDENIDNTNNEQIRVYNEIIKRVAAEKGAVYADIYKAVVNEQGVLPEGAASDGVHFGKDYYKKCLLYIQNNYQ